MKRTTLFLSAALLLAAAIVSAQPGSRFRAAGHMAHYRSANGGADTGVPGGPPVDKLTSYLSLTDAQQTAWKQLRDKLDTTVKPLFETAQRKQAAIRDGLDNNADAATLGQLMIDAHRIRQQIKATHVAYEKDFTALLTADQAAKYQSFQELRASFRPGHGPLPPPQQ